MNADFRMDFSNSDEYEYLALEITYCHQRICSMFRTNDGNSIDIEFNDDLLLLKTPVRLKFPLTDFLESVEVARTRLMGLVTK